tara:strand:+ start:438 stop:707 length:270 start_codon:yes stop_codon:yes gene_type:complete
MNYKFNEDNTIKQIQRYVDGTYERHYAQGKYQATDMIIDAGHGESFCMGNIMKYAMRCGKKDGTDAEMDLLKIIHYAIIAIHLQDIQDD